MNKIRKALFASLETASFFQVLIKLFFVGVYYGILLIVAATVAYCIVEFVSWLGEVETQLFNQIFFNK